MTERGHGPAFWITTIIAELVLAVLASTIVMWFSRRREFRAGAGGAKLAGTDKMIGALESLKRGVGGATLARSDGCFWDFWRHRSRNQTVFLTHLPLDERIAALQRRSA